MVLQEVQTREAKVIDWKQDSDLQSSTHQEIGNFIKPYENYKIEITEI